MDSRLRGSDGAKRRRSAADKSGEICNGPPNGESASEASGAPVVLDARESRTHIFTRWGVTRAVDGARFAIREGAGVYSGPRRPR